MKSRLGDSARLKHILMAINEIESYLINQTFDSFASNSMMKNATVRQLEIIGEAVGKLSEELKSKFINIDWKAISGMRNILIHEYFGVNLSMVWKTAINDLPVLKKIVIQSIEHDSTMF